MFWENFSAGAHFPQPPLKGEAAVNETGANQGRKMRPTGASPGQCSQSQPKGGGADDGGSRLSCGAFAAACMKILFHAIICRDVIIGVGCEKGRFYYPDSRAFSPRDK